jgi:hypothetical protein
MKLTSWSPSRLEKYESCPRRAKYDLIDKLCPMCFEGKLHGGFDSPQICDTCGKKVEQAEPLVRGSEIGANLEGFVNGKVPELHPAIRHAGVKKIAIGLRKDFKKRMVMVEHQIVLDKDWRPTSPFNKSAWLRAKLDVLRLPDKHAEVIDWKTGGIDRRTGEVKADEKYKDQLGVYAVATLSGFPMVEYTTASLVFVDCGPRFDPCIERPEGTVARKELPKLQAKWTKRVKALLSDDVFAPRASTKCGYCPFQKGKGGPCPF